MKFDWKYFFGFTKLKAVLLFLTALLSFWFAKNLCIIPMPEAGTSYSCILMVFLLICLPAYLLLSIIFYFKRGNKYLKMIAYLIILFIIIGFILNKLGIV